MAKNTAKRSAARVHSVHDGGDLARKLADLVGIFRRGGPADDFRWWDGQSPQSMFNPRHGYQDGKALFEEIVQGVLALNPQMLSQTEVDSRIKWQFLQRQTGNLTLQNHLHNQDLVDKASTFLKELLEFEAWHDVDIPIANLLLEDGPVEIGRASLFALTREEIEDWKKRVYPLWSSTAPNCQTVARVHAPGDQSKATLYARTQVELALNVLRAFCFPFGSGIGVWQVGIVGEIVSYNSTPMRIDGQHYPTQVKPVAQIELGKDILEKLPQNNWVAINELVLKPSPNDMENKLLTSIHWLGESTKPETNNSKFTKISVAFEALLGGEPKDKHLSVRGITAMLAERVAFLLGDDLASRMVLDKVVRKYYDVRSDIVHEGHGKASDNDIDGFGRLVRGLILAMLGKTDTISNIENLEKWVRQQKYSSAIANNLPSQNGTIKEPPNELN